METVNWVELLPAENGKKKVEAAGLGGGVLILMGAALTFLPEHYLELESISNTWVVRPATTGVGSTPFRRTNVQY